MIAMILKIMACNVVNCHKKNVVFGMEKREASHTNTHPNRPFTHHMFIVYTSQRRYLQRNRPHGHFYPPRVAHSRVNLGSWPKGTKDGNEATNLINFVRESSQVYANTISGANTFLNPSTVWSGSVLLVGENKVSAECPLGSILIPSRRRIIGTMLA